MLGEDRLSLPDSYVKVHIKWKIIADYLKGFSKNNNNVVCLFGISSFVLEIFTFLYYTNEESDDVITSST